MRWNSRFEELAPHDSGYHIQMNTRFTLSLVLAALFAVSLFAADVVGTWKGQMEITDPSGKNQPIPEGQSPQLVVNLKADKTYTSTQKGGGGGDAAASGTWSSAGNKVTLLPKKRDGKAASGDGAAPRNYTVSQDGKSMSMDVTAILGKSFSPEQKAQMKGLKFSIVLKKS